MASASSLESSSPSPLPPGQGVLFLYMLTNRKPGVPTTTQIGCCTNVEKRVSLFNSEDLVPGSDRRARLAAGWWKPVLIIAVPRASPVSARALVLQWKMGARKIHCRFEYGVSLARGMNFVYFVDLDEVREDPRIADHAAFTITWLKQALDDSPDRVQRLARTVVSDDDACTFPTTWQGLSFARADRPRQRYQKSQKAKKSSGKNASGSKRRALLGKAKSPPAIDVAKVLAQAQVA